MDQSPVAFIRSFGGRSSCHRTEKFSLFNSFEASFLAFVSLAVERLGDRGRTTLLAEGENLDVIFSPFVLDVEHVADTDLACWLGRLAIRQNTLQLAGLGGLFAGLEEACRPKPFVDAGSGHAGIVVDLCGGVQLNGSEHAARKREERRDELECAAGDDADKAEGKEDKPDEREEDDGCEGEGPAEEGEEAEEKEVEHQVLCLLKIERWVGGKVPSGG